MSSLITSLYTSVIVRGVSALSFARYSTKVLSLLRLALVARLLGTEGPAQLGVYGLTLLSLAIMEVLSETGINLVLLKKPTKLDEYLDTAWGISILRGIGIGTTLFLLAAPLARWYQISELETYLLVATAIPVVRGFLNPSLVLFQQRLEFAKESLLRITIQLIDIVSGVLLVWWLNSALGLILGILVGVIAELVFSFSLFSQWPDLRRFSWKKLSNLYQESAAIIGNGILYYFSENADDLLIGKLLGPAGLGYYQTAYKFASALTLELAAIFSQATYPIYARYQSQPKKLRQLWWQSTLFYSATMALILIPVLLSAHWIILMLFGEPWLHIVPVIRILLVAGALKGFVSLWNPLSVLGENLGHSIVLHLILLITLLSGIWILVPPFGLIGASWAVGIAFSLMVPYGMFIVHQALRRLNA